MSDGKLRTYIETARGKGATDEQIRGALLKSGWQESIINSSLKEKSIDILSVPTPPAPHFGMWVGFLYVMLFISLYVWATALGGIFHFAVDELLPDKLDNLQVTYNTGQYLMQFYIASLMVAYPIFAVLFLILKRQAIKNPAVRGIKVRKFLIYLTLIGTFIIMMGHLIGTVYQLLGGSVTERSIAHLFVTVLVAGSIFAYFFLDVWGDRKQT
ncbi:MAG TPA: DUF5671 domain-containing protein [Candidatus Levybacteria bacterium]|nr:DUF5671 domain-containing protein [Candidatus Levybacteria bacterium]